MTGHRSIALLSVGTVLGALLLAPPATASPQPDPVRNPAPDYCGDQCHHVLPPGQNGNATLADLAGHMLLGTVPPHSDD